MIKVDICIPDILSLYECPKPGTFVEVLYPVMRPTGESRFRITLKPEVKTWLIKNNIKYRYYEATSYRNIRDTKKIHIFFKTEMDAILFKMRWL